MCQVKGFCSSSVSHTRFYILPFPCLSEYNNFDEMFAKVSFLSALPKYSTTGLKPPLHARILEQGLNMRAKCVSRNTAQHFVQGTTLTHLIMQMFKKMCFYVFADNLVVTENLFQLFHCPQYAVVHCLTSPTSIK